MKNRYTAGRRILGRMEQKALSGSLGLILVASASMMLGCAPHARPVQVPQSNLRLSEDVQLNEFEAKEIKFASSTLFLWREGTTPDQAKTVMDMAAQVDGFYDELGTYSTEWKSIEGAVLRDGVDRRGITQVQGDLESKRRGLEIAEEKVASFADKIKKLEAELAAATSAAKKRRIQQNLDGALNGQQGYIRQRDQVKSEIAGLENRFVELGGNKASYSAYNARMPGINGARNRIEGEVKRLLDGIAGTNGLGPETKVVGLVDPIEQSISSFVLAAKADGSLSVMLEMGSALEDVNDPAAKVYSTENGKVTHARYSTLGGIYEFDIELAGFKHNNPRTGTVFEVARPVRVHWKLSRCNLLSSDHHVRLKGDLEIYDLASNELLRRGVAKLDSGEKFEDAPVYWDQNEQGIFNRVREARRQIRGN